MIKSSTSSFIFITTAFLSLCSQASAESWRYQTRGYLTARLTSYTENAKNYGQQTRAQIEGASDFGSNLSAIDQLRWTSNSINADLSTVSSPSKKDMFQAYLGENYLKYKSDSWVAQIGYQEVVWGEAFGQNFADIINPKDLRETFYSDASEARFPLLLFNEKTFFTLGGFSGSLQLLYSPEPRFSKTLPVEIYAGNLLSVTTLNVNKESTPEIFKKSEFGGKFAGSYSGFDFGIFGYSYYDRDPHYTLRSATLSSISINEEHSKIKSLGVSLAKTLGDFVLRSDIVLTKNKLTNYVENLQLKSFSSDTLNALVSIDTPTYNDYSGVLIYAQSSLKDILPNSFRQKDEEYLIGKITKNIDHDKSLELSYTHEFKFTGHSIQSQFSWPITQSTDLKLGGQFYFGDKSSNLNKYKNVSGLFISLKNYFQF